MTNFNEVVTTVAVLFSVSVPLAVGVIVVAFGLEQVLRWLKRVWP